MDPVYLIGISSAIPLAWLNKHLPKNEMLAKVRVNLLLHNEKLHTAEQSLLAGLPRLDFRAGIQCDPGKELKESLTHLSAKVHLLTAEGAVAFEADISWNVFSANDISNGGMRMILTEFRCTMGREIICPIDMWVSITQSSVAFAETRAVWPDSEVHKVSNITHCSYELNLKCNAAEQSTLGADTSLPLDLSVPRHVKPHSANLLFTSDHIVTQTARSCLDCGTLKKSQDALTQTKNLPHPLNTSVHQNKFNDTVNIEGRRKKLLKRLRPVIWVNNPRHQDHSTRPDLEAIGWLDSKLTQLEKQLSNKR